MVSRLRLTVLALVIAGAAPAAAAPLAAQQPPPAGAPTDDMSPMQVHQLFDAMLVMQAQDALALSEQQYAQFVTRLRVLQDARRRNQQDRVRLMGELQKLSNPRNPKPVDQSELTRRLSALQELESRQAADLRRAYDGIDEVLNPLQQARFRVLEEQIERRKLELVGRARQNNQRPIRRPPGQ